MTSSPETTVPRVATVTVVIATTCEAKREEAISRAVDSVLTQEGADVSLLIVVNGSRFDQRILDRLLELPRTRVEQLAEGSYPAAVRHGRTLVATEFFAYLDDDDEFMPDAIATRLAPLLADATLDFVATNGYLHDGSRVEITKRNSTAIERNPIQELLRANWMENCGNLFRSSTVSLDYFDGKTKYYEWTLLTFRIAQALKLRFLDAPTYRKHESPESLYKSVGVAEGGIAAIDLMISHNTSPAVHQRLLQLRGAALHATSDVYRMAGDYGRAWRFHLQSLRHPRGWTHLPYTRHLLLPRAGAR
ncbi:MAG: glycosyltransferase family 2 protein [bacterium]